MEKYLLRKTTPAADDARCVDTFVLEVPKPIFEDDDMFSMDT